MKIKTLILIFFFFGSSLNAQSNLLEHPDYLPIVKECLYATYGYNFEKAKSLQKEFQDQLPNHPAPYFLNTLIIYWENFPLLPKNPIVKEFEWNADKTIELAKDMMKSDHGMMEGVFFDMHARAYKGMFWADNGKPAKTLLDLDNMYRSTMRGIEYKKEFNEFYFSSGLYNYYIEAYVEKHPEYKPVVGLLREGNAELGLKELQIAVDSATYIQYEALLFMSLVQLNYEENLSKALDYSSRLYNIFPKNIYYLGQYLITLLYSENYLVASVLNEKLKNHPDPFHQMIYSMTEGFLQENSDENYRTAKIHYRQVLRLAETYGPIADLYAAIAHAGLSRIAQENGDKKTSRKQRKKSTQLSPYDFILNF